MSGTGRPSGMENPLIPTPQDSLPVDPVRDEFIKITGSDVVRYEPFERGRGLLGYGSVPDGYQRSTIDVYESSSAEGPRLWVSMSDKESDRNVTAHLSPVGVIALRDLLDRFLSDIPERWGEGQQL